MECAINVATTSATTEVLRPVSLDTRGEKGARLFERVLDEIDYGLIVSAADGSCHHSNRTARAALARGAAVQLVHGRLVATHAWQQPRLLAAIGEGCAGRRRMVMLGQGADEVPIVVTPVAATEREREPLCLAILGKAESCSTLTLEFFTRIYGLTLAEAAVLRQLSRGQSPKEIARASGVAMATIRTQISSVRAKCGAGSIYSLSRRLSALPPLSHAFAVSTAAAGG
jgi:DNA-binding CsgD family transcriptional regulator